jgi:hypothetical protein
MLDKSQVTRRPLNSRSPFSACMSPSVMAALGAHTHPTAGATTAAPYGPHKPEKLVMLKTGPLKTTSPLDHTLGSRGTASLFKMTQLLQASTNAGYALMLSPACIPTAIHR